MSNRLVWSSKVFGVREPTEISETKHKRCESMWWERASTTVDRSHVSHGIDSAVHSGRLFRTPATANETRLLYTRNTMRYYVVYMYRAS